MATKKDGLRNWVAKPALRWAVSIYFLVVLVITATSFFTGSLTEQERAQISLGAEQTDLRERVAQLERMISSSAFPGPQPIENSQPNRESLSSAELADSADLVAQVSELAGSVGNLEEDLRGLRSLLQPPTSEELLTVLRLGDRFEVFGAELSSLDRRIDANHQAALRHVDVQTNNMRWLFALLVPIVLSFAKDYLPRGIGRRGASDHE